MYFVVLGILESSNNTFYSKWFSPVSEPILQLMTWIFNEYIFRLSQISTFFVLVQIANMIESIIWDVSLVWAFISASHLASSISIRATGYVTK